MRLPLGSTVSALTPSNSATSADTSLGLPATEARTPPVNKPNPPTSWWRLAQIAGYFNSRGTRDVYSRAEEANARCFDLEGFYRSGDLVRQHPDGNLVVTGRVKDVIHRGGETIPRQISKSTSELTRRSRQRWR
jgi:acyl-CoA synthetase (AMP-forming)/AMP-acid ligase II